MSCVLYSELVDGRERVIQLTTRQLPYLSLSLSVTSLVARQGLPGYLASSMPVLLTRHKTGVIYGFLL